MRTLVYLLLAFYAFSAIAFAQHGPWKFDEFTDKSTVTYYPYTEITLANRIARFKKELQKNRTAKPYIIFYRGRVYYERNRYETERWFETPRQELREIHRFEDQDKVPEVFGGYRDQNTLEFWIVPKGAKPPPATPTIKKTETITCPGITVYPDGFHFDKSKPVTFTAKVQTETSAEFLYEWNVTNGEIISGKSRDDVRVDVSKSNSDLVTATVKIDGLAPPCRNVGVASLQVGSHPYLFDYTEYFNYSDLSARIDNLMITINNNPTLKAYVICYSPRTGYSSGINSGLINIRKSFVFRKYSYDQVVLIDGGSRDLATVEMWLVPPGVEPPKPRPYVNPRFVKKSKQRHASDIYY